MATLNLNALINKDVIGSSKNYFHRNSVAAINLGEEFNFIKKVEDIYSSISEESESISEKPVIKSNKNEIRIKTINLKSSESAKYRKILKIIDTLYVTLALSGLFSSMFDFEFNYIESEDVRFSNMIRTYTSLTTAVCVILAIFSSRLSYTISRERKIIFEQKITKYSQSFELRWLVVEILIIIIHCPPYYNPEFEFKQLNGVLIINLNSICCSLMMLRLVILVKILIHYSKWNSEKARVICNEDYIDNDIIFSLKAILKDKPHFLLIPAFLVSTVVLGISIQIYERPFNMDNSSFGDGNSMLDYSYIYNALWLVLLTMTTVGFGDFYPRTHVGRFIAVISAVWGTFLISLLIIMFNNYVLFSEREERSFKVFERIRKFERIKEYSKKIIKYYIEIYMYKRFHDMKESDELIQERLMQIGYCKAKHKKTMRDLNKRDADVKNSLCDLNEKLGINLEKIKNNINQAKEMETEVDSLIESQKKVLEYLLICSKFSRDTEKFLNFK